QREKIGCIVFSPLAQGLLSTKYLSGIPSESRAAKPHGALRPAHITEEKLLRVRRLNEMAQARGQTLAQMALAWVLRMPEITSALIGVNTVQQLEENLACLQNLKFSRQELEAIDRVLATR
ncbi:L-glyceraldehyde 3-phosphate reductase, partial [bacterium]|nr:L-glyceraldehyde 3-phosphate reductase [bacterium]